MHKTQRLLFLTFLITFANIKLSSAETVLFFAPTRVEIVDSKPVQEIRVTKYVKHSAFL